MFKDLIEHTIEVCVDDMLVKSVRRSDQREAFDLLQKYQLKLNPEKYTFGVAFGKFLEYLVTQLGIKANFDQISADPKHEVADVRQGDTYTEWAPHRSKHVPQPIYE